jgi:antitoxin MazE
MTTTIRKWGNSLGVRIPRDIAEDAGLSEGKEVMLEKRDGRLTLRPVARNKVSLDALVRKMTPHNQHVEIEWGKPRGKEIW